MQTQNFKIKALALLLLCGLTLGLRQLRGQEPFVKTHKLPGNFGDCKIATLMQDHDGFIWLGTSCGLIMFDGINYRMAPENIPAGSVSALFQSVSGDFWIGYESGLLIAFDDKSREITMVEQIPEGNAITGIAQDQNGNLWFSAYGQGIFFHKNDSLHHITRSGGLADLFIYSIISDKSGKIWAASDAGINIITFENNRLHIHHLGVSDGLPDVMITSLAKDHEGNIYAGGYQNGFCMIDSKSLEIEYRMGSKYDPGPVSGILPGKRFTWITTEIEGLIRIDNESGHFQNFRQIQGQSLQRLQGIFRGREGNIWCWRGENHFQIPGEKFSFVYTGKTNKLSDVHALLIDDEGYLWYASEYGLFRHRQIFSGKEYAEKINIPASISSRDITCLYQDVTGYIWIGTFGGGLYRLNPDEKGGIWFTEQDGLINNNILAISEGMQEIWFATLGGASKYLIPQNPEHRGQFINFDEEQGLGNNFIYDVLVDDDQNIWFATDGTGITLLENGNFTNFGPDQGLMSEKVYVLTTDKQNRLWCATHDNNIYYYENGLFHEIPLIPDPNTTISALEVDELNNLLIVQQNGLSIYNINTDNVTHFGSQAGISPIDPEFNSTAVSTDGAIWVGTENGLIKYTPVSNNKIQHPQAVITEVSVFLQPVKSSYKSEFSYNENHFTFNYIGLWYHHPELVSYQVMLEGNDLEWKPTADRQISYANLSPGNYTFKVRASQYKDFPGTKAASYSFKINAPFWSTWWFYAIVALLIAVAIYSIVRIRLARLQRIQALERDKIMFQYETLKSQVNPHFLFNSFSTLMNVIEENRDVAIEYVEKLSVFFRNILEFREKNLIGVDEEIRVIKNYIYLQKRRYGDNLTVHIDLTDEALNTFIPPLTMQLLVENAIKHNIVSRSKPLEIDILSEGEFLIIKNNLQPKSFTGDSTGFGLKTIKHRYRLFGKDNVTIDKQDRIFIVSLPYIKDKVI